MNNKLFLVCPFSNMETFIRKEYGKDVFFMTSMAAIFQSADKKYVKAIGDIISLNHITSIYIVNDTACPFISNIVNREPLFGTGAETILEEIFIENISLIVQESNLYMQKKKLAEINIRNQANKIMKADVLGELITQEKLKVICVLSEKSKNKHFEIENRNKGY